jgi:hypothetical protein
MTKWIEGQNEEEEGLGGGGGGEQVAISCHARVHQGLREAHKQNLNVVL